MNADSENEELGKTIQRQVLDLEKKNCAMKPDEKNDREMCEEIKSIIEKEVKDAYREFEIV